MHKTDGDKDGHPHGAEISLTFHRIIDAPVETVYAAWTDPSVLKRWMAPGGAVVEHAAADISVGGSFRIEMRGTDGRRSAVRGLYREVVPCHRLVHTWRWEGSDVETLVTIEFEPGPDGKTHLTLTHSRFARDEARNLHEHGWSGCLVKLDDAVCSNIAGPA